MTGQPAVDRTGTEVEYSRMVDDPVELNVGFGR